MAGTAALVFVGLSAVCVDFGARSPVVGLVPDPSWRLLLTGLCFAGAGSLVAISPLGRLSGAHLNPAVTLAFWSRGMMHRHDLAGYIAAQFAGGSSGAALAALAWGGVLRAVGYGATVPGQDVSAVAAMSIEAAMTAALVLTILLLVSHPRTMRLTPLVTWLLAATLVWQGARYTGTGMNPARSALPDILRGRADVLWVYTLGPLTGAMLAAFLYSSIPGRLRPVTAKLFHDPRYPSIFGGRARSSAG